MWDIREINSEASLYLMQDLNRDEHLSRSKYNLIGIDMQKAFDRIDHSYVMQVVKKLGFSDNMIKWYVT